jgi:hypothetical protein
MTDNRRQTTDDRRQTTDNRRHTLNLSIGIGSTITADVVFRSNKGLYQLLYDDLST